MRNVYWSLTYSDLIDLNCALSSKGAIHRKEKARLGDVYSFTLLYFSLAQYYAIKVTIDLVYMLLKVYENLTQSIIIFLELSTHKDFPNSFPFPFIYNLISRYFCTKLSTLELSHFSTLSLSIRLFFRFFLSFPILFITSSCCTRYAFNFNLIKIETFVITSV